MTSKNLGGPLHPPGRGSRAGGRARTLHRRLAAERRVRFVRSPVASGRIKASGRRRARGDHGSRSDGVSRSGRCCTVRLRAGRAADPRRGCRQLRRRAGRGGDRGDRARRPRTSPSRSTSISSGTTRSSISTRALAPGAPPCTPTAPAMSWSRARWRPAVSTTTGAARPRCVEIDVASRRQNAHAARGARRRMPPSTGAPAASR